MPKVTPEMCKELRRKVKQGNTEYTDILSVDVTNETLLYHIRGECSHEIDEEHIDYNFGVTKDECEEMRKLYKQDCSWREIANELGKTTGSVSWHVSGECVHNVETLTEEPPGNVDETECNKIRKMYEDIGTYAEVGRKINRHKHTVKLHVKARCSHDVEKDICQNTFTEAQKSKNSISEAKCHKIRELYKSKKSSDKVQETVNACKNTILRHAKANCNHDVTENIFENVNRETRNHIPITSSECIKMREMALNINKQADIAEEFNCSLSTVRLHVHNNCSHETHGIYEKIVIPPINEHRCHVLRYLYYDEAMKTNKIAELKNIGVSEKTIKKHVCGYCSHKLE
jgi:IS30 family transposase